MKIERFEDIEAWKMARELTQRIYSLTQNGNFAKDFGLKNQITRAAVSIMANRAEGFDSQTDLVFIRYLFNAKGSASEVQSHLYVALDFGYITDKEFQKCYDFCDSAKNLIGGFIKYLSKE
ncbi:MAG: hypothetical protein MAGBODY4_00847 [Candidatus Marinimicrobia bacterium]|nr:hypothetical protein [Candidatus Neomarinimicrobiota bacterium]